MKHLVIANRGEIACRILKTAQNMGYFVSVISTQDDKNSLICRLADQVLLVSSFLNGVEIIDACQKAGAQFIHPGYGFLSENAEFVRLIELTDMTFIGPTSLNMKLMGSKESAKKMAQQCGVPTLNALFSQELKSLPVSSWKEIFIQKNIHAPYLVKASGGGGGRGMRVVDNFDDLPNALMRASQEAKSAFQDETVFVECYLKNPKHIEIQIFGDGQGGGVFWGERECSLQRRHQKVIEEAPSINVTPELREKMGRCSLNLVKETKYLGAGTLEYLLDENNNFYFLEMNTRLQVEHPITENVYEIDLVKAQIEMANKKWPSNFPNPTVFSIPEPKGYSIEARILAENPENNFLPTPGKIEFYKSPNFNGIRVDSGVECKDVINPNYDSMISKLIVHAPTRELAIHKLTTALESYPILGFTNNILFLRNIIQHQDFAKGLVSTGWIEKNLSELNIPIIPSNIVEIFQSFGFREKLSLFMLGKWTQTPIENLFSKLNFSPSQTNSKNISYELIQGPFLNSYVIQFQNNNSFLFYAVRISLENIQIFYKGQTVIVECPHRVLNHCDQESLVNGIIKTPMPGKLVDIFVQEGESVLMNQVLFVIESMKIQMEVKSSKTGTIEKINFAKGHGLVGDDILAIIS